MTARVEVDTRALVAGVRKLADGVADGAPSAARKAAEDTAAKVKALTPVRTGRLASSVGVEAENDGWGVTYGAGVSYARPVAARTRNVADGIAGAADAFARDCKTVAERQVARL